MTSDMWLFAGLVVGLAVAAYAIHGYLGRRIREDARRIREAEQGGSPKSNA